MTPAQRTAIRAAAQHAAALGLDLPRARWLIERAWHEAALARHGGNVSALAFETGRDRGAMQRTLVRLGLRGKRHAV